MAKGKDERYNPMRKVGRGHPLMAERKQQRAESGYNPGMTVGGEDMELERRLRQRPSADQSE